MALITVKHRPGVLLNSNWNSPVVRFLACVRTEARANCAGWIVNFRTAAGVLAIEVESTDKDNLAAGEPECRVTLAASNEGERGVPDSGLGII